VTLSAAHAAAFYREVRRHGVVWAISDEQGFPAPLTMSGKRAMPFWSSRTRAQAVIAAAEAYASFSPVSLPIAEWAERWLPGLEKDGLMVGLNWYGKTATGYEFQPHEVLSRLSATGS
jgi:hypothetical protein